MKEIIIGIVFIIGALLFIAAGFYFKSKKYLAALCDGIYEEKQKKAKSFFANVTGYFSMALGYLTLICGIMFFVFPKIKYYIALIYIIIFAVMAMIYMSICGNKVRSTKGA
ncbi:MAG: hypothetical protein K5640_07220 [Treponema sp.]|nr:hypothetical protein [Treponema sp.]